MGCSFARSRRCRHRSHLRFRDEQPTVVPLLGYHVSPSFMVTKFYALGTMKQYLSTHHWSRPLAYSLLSQVAQGMCHLHSHDIVHHDLKADNVLVDELEGSIVAKIADFGLAKVRVRVGGEDKPQTTEYRGAQGATVRFAPPEYFDGAEMGKAADSWMFAMMCYQVLSGGKEPYDYCPYDRVVSVLFFFFSLPPCLCLSRLIASACFAFVRQLIRAINRGDRPPRPDDVPERLWTLMQACWNKRSKERPDFEWIRSEMESVVAGK